MMKQFILLLSFPFCMFAGASQAQVLLGTTYLGGTIGGSVKHEEASSKTTSFNFNLAAGHFISSHWMIGLQGNMNTSKVETDIASPAVSATGYNYYFSRQAEVKTTVWGVGPVARYYKSLNNKIYFFTEGNAGFARTKNTINLENKAGTILTAPNPSPGTPIGSVIFQGPVSSRVSSETYEQNNLYANMSPGIAFFPAPKVGIELKINVLTYTYCKDAGYAFDADFSLANTSIGAGFYF